MINPHSATITTPPHTPEDEREIDVLAWVHHQQDPTVSQRSIAGALGMSVGLTNAILFPDLTGDS